MASDRLQLALQAHLAEYSALRQELLELVAIRHVRAGFVLWMANCLPVLASLFLLVKGS